MKIESSKGWILKAMSPKNFQIEIGNSISPGEKYHVIEYSAYQQLEDIIRRNDKDILAYHALKDLHQEVRNDRNRLKYENEELHRKIRELTISTSK